MAKTCAVVTAGGSGFYSGSGLCRVYVSSYRLEWKTLKTWVGPGSLVGGRTLAYGQLDKGGGDVEREQKEESSRHTQNPLTLAPPVTLIRNSQQKTEGGTKTRFLYWRPLRSFCSSSAWWNRADRLIHTCAPSLRITATIREAEPANTDTWRLVTMRFISFVSSPFDDDGRAFYL